MYMYVYYIPSYLRYVYVKLHYMYLKVYTYFVHCLLRVALCEISFFNFTDNSKRIGIAKTVTYFI